MTEELPEIEPIGYDGFGAPIYEHQFPWSLRDMVNASLNRMVIPQATLPEVFTRHPYPLPFKQTYAFIDETHWFSRDDEDFQAIVNTQVSALAKAAAKAADDELARRLETWSADFLEASYGPIDYDRILAVTGRDFRRPLAEQDIPARGQE